MRQPVNIPALCPHPVGNPDSIGSYVSSQPIIQLKELEIDRVRYYQWLAWCKADKRRQARKARQAAREGKAS